MTEFSVRGSRKYRFSLAEMGCVNSALMGFLNGDE